MRPGVPHYNYNWAIPNFAQLLVHYPISIFSTLLERMIPLAAYYLIEHTVTAEYVQQKL